MSKNERKKLLPDDIVTVSINTTSSDETLLTESSSEYSDFSDDKVDTSSLLPSSEQTSTLPKIYQKEYRIIQKERIEFLDENTIVDVKIDVDSDKDSSSLPPVELKGQKVGVCLSSGGIRSAAFDLGIFEAFIELKKFHLIDFISAVSGSGYFAFSFLSFFTSEVRKRSFFNQKRYYKCAKRAIKKCRIQMENNFNYLTRSILSILHLFFATTIGMAINILVLMAFSVLIVSYAYFGMKRDIHVYNPVNTTIICNLNFNDFYRIVPCVMDFYKVLDDIQHINSSDHNILNFWKVYDSSVFTNLSFIFVIIFIILLTFFLAFCFLVIMNLCHSCSVINSDEPTVKKKKKKKKKNFVYIVLVALRVIILKSVTFAIVLAMLVVVFVLLCEVLKVGIFLAGFYEKVLVDYLQDADSMILSLQVGIAIVQPAVSVFAFSFRSKNVFANGAVLKIILGVISLNLPLLLLIFVSRMAIWFTFDIEIKMFHGLNKFLGGHLLSVIQLISFGIIIVYLCLSKTLSSFLQTTFQFQLSSSFLKDGKDVKLSSFVKRPLLISNSTLNNYYSEKSKKSFFSFFYSPIFSGCEQTGFVETSKNKLLSVFPTITAGRALSTSSATVSINMGRFDSSINSIFFKFLLFVFSIDLGNWSYLSKRHRKPKKKRSSFFEAFQIVFEVVVVLLLLIVLLIGVTSVVVEVFYRSGMFIFDFYNWVVFVFMFFSFLFLFLNTISRKFSVAIPSIDVYRKFSQIFNFFQTKDSIFYHLSDGQHTDSLGLYQLIKREVDVIFCFDSTSQSEQQKSMTGLFYILNQLIEENSIEEKVEIDSSKYKIKDLLLKEDLEYKFTNYSNEYFIKMKVQYKRTEKKCTIVYVKGGLTGREDVLVQLYSFANRNFPNKSQFSSFNKTDFGAYRRLGNCIAKDVLTKM